MVFVVFRDFIHTFCNYDCSHGRFLGKRIQLFVRILDSHKHDDYNWWMFGSTLLVIWSIMSRLPFGFT
ncbi:hypothetical protein Hanom_Chr06g00502341 [Helianthus anomalus]